MLFTRAHLKEHCHCEPNVSILKSWGIATPVCGLVRNDNFFFSAVNNNLSVRWARNMDDAFLMQVCYTVENERRGSNYG